MRETITTLVESFFHGMNITITKLTISWDDALYDVHIETPDSSLIIGVHGAWLDAIKHLLGRMIDSITKKHTILHLEVNDYVKMHDEKLYHYLDGRVAYAMKSGQDVAVPNLNAYDRKKAHTYISEKNIEKLRTYSAGEWSDRCLHIVYEWEISSSHHVHTESKHRILEISEDGIDV